MPLLFCACFPPPTLPKENMPTHQFDGSYHRQGLQGRPNYTARPKPLATTATRLDADYTPTATTSYHGYGNLNYQASGHNEVQVRLWRYQIRYQVTAQPRNSSIRCPAISCTITSQTKTTQLPPLEISHTKCSCQALIVRICAYTKKKTIMCMYVSFLQGHSDCAAD